MADSEGSGMTAFVTPILFRERSSVTEMERENTGRGAAAGPETDQQTDRQRDRQTDTNWKCLISETTQNRMTLCKASSADNVASFRARFSVTYVTPLLSVLSKPFHAGKCKG